ncbi:DUF805 domain-containing protein [Chitinimonas sp.]|uniref:DUF805 domain-containing protein n=1 Tax=Chitinimonas sp. TaxID=1934313 RepID=UPI0035AF2D36
MEATFNIALSGKTLPGFAIPEVHIALANLLKLEQAQIEQLLSGRETIIKRNLPREKLNRYLQAVNQTGAETRVYPVGESSFPSLLDEPLIESVNERVAEAVATAAAPEVARPTAAANAQGAVSILDAAPPSQFEITQTGLLPLPDNAEMISCPVCQFTQIKRTLCRQCGADMPRVLAAASKASETPQGYQHLPAHRRPDAEFLDEEEAPPLFAWHFDGRIGRTRYLAYSLVMSIPMAIAGIALAVLTTVLQSPALLIPGIIAVAIPSAWQLFRLWTLRLHDLGLSGKWLLVFPIGAILGFTHPAQLVGLMAVFGITQLFLWACPGNRNANVYGTPPGEDSIWIKLGALLYVLFTLSSSYQGQQQGLRASAARHAAQPAEPAESDDAMDKAFGEAVDRGAAERGVTLTPEKRARLIQEMRARYQSQPPSAGSDAHE